MYLQPLFWTPFYSHFLITLFSTHFGPFSVNQNVILCFGPLKTFSTYNCLTLSQTYFHQCGNYNSEQILLQ